MAKAKTTDIGGRTLDVLQGGMSRGREVMDEAMNRGQQVLQDWVPRRRRDPVEGWLWFAGGIAVGAVGLLLARRATPTWAWAGRRVADVMVQDVQTIDSTASLTQAAQRMRDANVGVLPVVDAGRLRGVVTDRDLVVRGMARGIDAASIRVSECATQDLVAARKDWSVEQAMQTMAEHQIGRLPVVDEMDRVIGIVTLSSLALRTPRQDEAFDAAKEVSRRSARAV